LLFSFSDDSDCIKVHSAADGMFVVAFVASVYGIFCLILYAMLVRVQLWPCVCLSPVGILLKQLNKSGGFLREKLSLTYPILFCNEIQVPPKLKVLPSGTLPQPLDYQFSLTKLGTLKVQ